MDIISLSGRDNLVIGSYTLAQIEHPTAVFLQEVEGEFLNPKVDHVYLSGHASPDVLLPFIGILHKHRIPFTVVESSGIHHAGLEITRNPDL